MKLKFLGRFIRIKEGLKKGKITNLEALVLYEKLILSLLLDNYPKL